MFYRERHSALTNASAAVNVDFSITKDGRARSIRTFSIQNTSNEPITAQPGIVEGADFFPLDEIHSVNNNDGYAMPYEALVFEGQFLRMVITGTNFIGLVAVYAAGVEREPQYFEVLVPAPAPGAKK